MAKTTARKSKRFCDGSRRCSQYSAEVFGQHPALHGAAGAGLPQRSCKHISPDLPQSAPGAGRSLMVGDAAVLWIHSSAMEFTCPAAARLPQAALSVLRWKTSLPHAFPVSRTLRTIPAARVPRVFEDPANAEIARTVRKPLLMLLENAPPSPDMLSGEQGRGSSIEVKEPCHPSGVQGSRHLNAVLEGRAVPRGPSTACVLRIAKHTLHSR
jgi:hypothetical protein